MACWNPYGEVPVFIKVFDARALEGGVELAWDIVSDEDVLGFKIYRRIEGEEASDDITAGGLIGRDERTYRDQGAGGGRTYEYTLAVVLLDRSEVRSQTVTVKVSAYAFALHQNTPNPFSPTTTISFTVPEQDWVTLSVYDVEGRLVRRLVDDRVGEGYREYVWDGKDTNGRRVSSGVYFCRLKTDHGTLTKKMLVLR